jgi:hypothetical protein
MESEAMSTLHAHAGGERVMNILSIECNQADAALSFSRVKRIFQPRGDYLSANSSAFGKSL